MNNETRSYIVLGSAATAYAAALNTEAGKQFAKDQTWVTVVFGTSLVLTALRFIMDTKEWRKVVTGFVVAGSPMIARSLWNKSRG